MSKKLKGFPLLFLAVSALTLMTIIVVASGAGSEADPLISKSYIDEVLLPKIYEYIDGKAAGGATERFEVITLGAGQRVMCGAGTEMIVRQGRGRVISTEKGGIADVTAGYDLPNNTIASGNHLLIVPLADGRGIFAEQDMLIMIKGSYEIK